MPEVRLYTDGACPSNGPKRGYGGWAYIAFWSAPGGVVHRREDSGWAHGTTNQRMELEAILRGLQALKRPCRVDLVTDSQYCKQGLEEWLGLWLNNGWQTRENGPVKNRDLWEAIVPYWRRHRIAVRWVRGHYRKADRTIDHQFNHEVDRLAVAARDLGWELRGRVVRPAEIFKVGDSFTGAQ